MTTIDIKFMEDDWQGHTLYIQSIQMQTVLSGMNIPGAATQCSHEMMSIGISSNATMDRVTDEPPPVAVLKLYSVMI